MSRFPFLALLVLLMAAGIGLAVWQHQALLAAQVPRIPSNPGPSDGAPAVEAVSAASASARADRRPSLELLKLRAEVTQLRAELDRDPVRARAEAQSATEWVQVFSGTQPSRMPDFVAFTNLAPRGNADPISAFATFQYHMRNQASAPMTPSRMKEIWDVPDDFDDPRARYSIHVGRGMGRETGYRVVEQQFLNPGEVRLVLDLEDGDGGSHRTEQTLVQRDGRWRVKPVAIERLPDPQPEPAEGR